MMAALLLLPDFLGMLNMNMLIRTVSFCYMLVNISLHLYVCRFSHFNWDISHPAEPA